MKLEYSTMNHNLNSDQRYGLIRGLRNQSTSSRGGQQETSTISFRNAQRLTLVGFFPRRKAICIPTQKYIWAGLLNSFSSVDHHAFSDNSVDTSR